MKKFSFFVFLCLLCSTGFTQQKVQKWSLSHINFHATVWGDNYASLAYPEMLAQVPNPELIAFGVDNTSTPSSYSSVISGGSLGISLSFNPYSTKTGTFNPKRELRLTMDVEPGSEGLVTYPSSMRRSEGATDDLEVTYCLMQSRIGMGAEYLFRTNIQQWFGAFIGIGTSSSITTSNQMLMFIDGTRNFDNGAESQEIHEEMTVNGRTNLTQKIYIPMGVEMRLLIPQLRAHLEGRYGMGGYKILGSKGGWIKDHFGISFGLSYVL